MANSAIYAVVAAVIVALVGGSNWTFMGLSFAILFASASVGIVAGFMFGAPRSSAASAGDAGSNSRLMMSSNLVKVSDWLTTLIVGLGLVQFRSVLGGIGKLEDQFGVIFGGRLPAEAAGMYGLTLLFSSFSLAFVVMYLWTSATVIEVFGDVGAQALSEEDHESR